MNVRPTSRFNSPGLALLAPAAERRRYAAIMRTLKPRAVAVRYTLGA